MTAATCSLNAGERAAQLDRYRVLGRGAIAVEHEPGRIVVRFFEDPPAGLLEKTIEVERRCCPFFILDYDPAARRLTVTAEEAEHHAGLDALAQAMRQRAATESLPPGAFTTDDPTPQGCCSSSGLAVCCDSQDKSACCGEATTAPPAQCGCGA